MAGTLLAAMQVGDELLIPRGFSDIYVIKRNPAGQFLHERELPRLREQDATFAPYFAVFFDEAFTRGRVRKAYRAPTGGSGFRQRRGGAKMDPQVGGRSRAAAAGRARARED